MERTVVDGRYDVVRPLGGGGMGEVYLARDQVLDREVALKVLRRQYAGDDEFAERFKREALNAAALSHPNIVQIYDRGETEDGAAYIAMEYLPGGTLKERITHEGPLEPTAAASIGSQVAEALDVAHARGVIHRDIKPQNILLTAKGEAKVGDFGIARAASAVTISQTGSVMGTASYMSPEQALGEPATPKSDLYSLGVVLYEAITGELPYTADNPIAVSMKHVNEPLRPPKEVNREIPEGMNALVVKLLAKNPQDRYADAEELADDLWKVRRGLAPTAAGPAIGGAGVPRSSTQATTVEAPASAPAMTSTSKRRLPIPVVFLVLLALIGLVWALSTLFQDFGLGDLLGGRAQAVEVPRVVGMDKDRAISELKGAGFETSISQQQGSAEESGVVLDQKPEGGQSAERESQIRLVVGASTVRVPQVVGLTLAEAQADLDRAGLGIGSQNEFPSQTAPEGQVVEQSIQPGTAVSPGTTVDLGISSGPGDPGPSAASSASASSSASATSSAPASSSASASSASAPPAESPASAPSSERQQEQVERRGERIEEAQKKAEERAEEAQKRAEERAKEAQKGQE